MSDEPYDVGNTVTMTAVFRDKNNLNQLFDPGTVVFYVTRPDTHAVVQVNGVKDSLGTWHGDIYADARGRWYYRVVTTTPNSASKRSFWVNS